MPFLASPGCPGRFAGIPVQWPFIFFLLICFYSQRVYLVMSPLIISRGISQQKL